MPCATFSLNAPTPPPPPPTRAPTLAALQHLTAAIRVAPFISDALLDTLRQLERDHAGAGQRRLGGWTVFRPLPGQLEEADFVFAKLMRILYQLGVGVVPAASDMDWSLIDCPPGTMVSTLAHRDHRAHQTVCGFCLEMQ